MQFDVCHYSCEQERRKLEPSGERRCQIESVQDQEVRGQAQTPQARSHRIRLHENSDIVQTG